MIAKIIKRNSLVHVRVHESNYENKQKTKNSKIQWNLIILMFCLKDLSFLFSESIQKLDMIFCHNSLFSANITTLSNENLSDYDKKMP